MFIFVQHLTAMTPKITFPHVDVSGYDKPQLLKAFSENGVPVCALELDNTPERNFAKWVKSCTAEDGSIFYTIFYDTFYPVVLQQVFSHEKLLGETARKDILPYESTWFVGEKKAYLILKPAPLSTVRSPRPPSSRRRNSRGIPHAVRGTFLAMIDLLDKLQTHGVAMISLGGKWVEFNAEGAVLTPWGLPHLYPIGGSCYVPLRERPSRTVVSPIHSSSNILFGITAVQQCDNAAFAVKAISRSTTLGDPRVAGERAALWTNQLLATAHEATRVLEGEHRPRLDLAMVRKFVRSGGIREHLNLGPDRHGQILTSAVKGHSPSPTRDSPSSSRAATPTQSSKVFSVSDLWTNFWSSYRKSRKPYK